MAPDLSADFEQAILDYLNGPSPLDGLLSGLQKTAKGVQTKGELQVEKMPATYREAKA